MRVTVELTAEELMKFASHDGRMKLPKDFNDVVGISCPFKAEYLFESKDPQAKALIKAAFGDDTIDKLCERVAEVYLKSKEKGGDK